MTQNEIIQYMKGHDEALLYVIELIDKYYDKLKIPTEFLREIETYNEGKQYEADATLTGKQQEAEDNYNNRGNRNGT
jgi:hypothetical protein